MRIAAGSLHDRPSQPARSTDNAFIGAFNGRFRTERLNQHWFMPVAAAGERLEAWRRYWNEERPEGAIGNKVPIMLSKAGAPPARHPERRRKTLPPGGARLRINTMNPVAPHADERIDPDGDLPDLPAGMVAAFVAGTADPPRATEAERPAVQAALTDASRHRPARHRRPVFEASESEEPGGA